MRNALHVYSLKIYVEILNPKVMVLTGGALELCPHELYLCPYEKKKDPSETFYHLCYVRLQ